MATLWDLYPVECRGGLVTNLSPIQQGINLPGSARRLVNFEPSIDGGYRRINGYVKYDSNYIPPRPNAYVQGSTSSGTVIIIGNLDETLPIGTSFTINGNSYAITAETSYTSASKEGQYEIDTSLDPADNDDGDTLIFANEVDVLTQGIYYFQSEVIAKRKNAVYSSTGSGWTLINAPDYGSPVVNGGGQTGTSFVVDGFDRAPAVGDTFRVAGINEVYNITAVSAGFTTGGTLTISPTLAASPADNAVITFIQSDLSSSSKTRFVTVDYIDAETLVSVDNTNYIQTYDGTDWNPLSNTGFTDTVITSPEFVEVFKASMFVAKENKLAFTAPYTIDDFTAANGGGIITLEDEVTGLQSFRDQLIVFCRNSIFRLVGNSNLDYQLLPITKDIGCVGKDSIQEVGGDILFLSDDGVRFLSASERIGDFSFALASRAVQNDTVQFIDANTEFQSLVVRSKSQYRIFGYKPSLVRANAKGWIGTQFADQTGQGLSWGEIQGIFVYVAHSEYSQPATGNAELVVFANNDGFAYTMETGNTYDGTAIFSEYWTPYLPINDPRVRKTIYKLTTFISPEGGFDGRFQLEFDFGDPGLIQPNAIQFDNDVSGGSSWGTGVWGTMVWGGTTQNTFVKQTTGSGFNVSIKYTFTEGSPFSIDVLGLEFRTNTRQ